MRRATHSELPSHDRQHAPRLASRESRRQRLASKPYLLPRQGKQVLSHCKALRTVQLACLALLVPTSAERFYTRQALNVHGLLRELGTGVREADLHPLMLRSRVMDSVVLLHNPILREKLFENRFDHLFIVRDWSNKSTQVLGDFSNR